MSGLDPLAAFALQAVANAQASLDEAAINLGSLVQDFQAQIAVGDILNATVLPPQNGSDRLLFLGQTIAAQLPPGINPGQTIALQVTGFTNTAILVRNLGVVDQPPSPAPLQNGSSEPPAPQAPAAAAPAELPPVVAPQAPPQRAILRATPPPEADAATPPRSASSPPVPSPAAPRTPGAPVAPPRELFVAASVRPPELSRAQAPASPAQTPPPAGRAIAPGEIEARIAATRARAAIPPKSVSAAPPPVAAARAGVPPHVSARAPVPANGTPPPVASPRPTPEAALLSRLRVPITATTLAAARVVDDATRTLTNAFEKLDSLLAKLPVDERTSPLRTTLSFVARFDLRNVRSLPEQIGAYLSHVVTGAESKVAQIVRAWSDGVAESMTSPLPQDAREAANSVARTPVSPQSPPPAASAPQAPAVSPAIVAARAAERDVALSHDVKSALLQLAVSPPAGSSPQLVAALRDALTAATAVQLNALQTQSLDPNVVTIPLPAYFHDGGAPAQLRISRDAPQKKEKMDADNFHIAFVLDTASLGTVAIDLTTVGRSVSVDVKTEAPRYADRFRSTLPDLRSRLEQLHYRVASVAAATAARTSQPAPAPASVTATPSDRNVDMRA